MLDEIVTKEFGLSSIVTSKASLSSIVDHNCNRCKLSKDRKNIVIGKWNESGPVMVIGEA